MSLKDGIKGFVEQSKRVISITYKPRPEEYKQMSTTTAIGITLIGVTGLIIATIFFFA